MDPTVCPTTPTTTTATVNPSKCSQFLEVIFILNFYVRNHVNLIATISFYEIILNLYSILQLNIIVILKVVAKYVTAQQIVHFNLLKSKLTNTIINISHNIFKRQLITLQLISF